MAIVQSASPSGITRQPGVLVKHLSEHDSEAIEQKKKALLVGCLYSGAHALQRPHSDIQDLKQLLIGMLSKIGQCVT